MNGVFPFFQITQNFVSINVKKVSSSQQQARYHAKLSNQPSYVETKAKLQMFSYSVGAEHISKHFLKHSKDGETPEITIYKDCFEKFLGIK